MTTTDTRNVQATVEQVMRCADAGADLVRITVQVSTANLMQSTLRKAFHDFSCTQQTVQLHVMLVSKADHVSGL